ADAHAIEWIPAARRLNAPLVGRRDRGLARAAGATHLNLESVGGEILRQRDRVAQRQARLDDDAAARRLGRETFTGQPGVQLLSRRARYEDVVLVDADRIRRGRGRRRLLRSGRLHRLVGAAHRFLDGVILLAQPRRDLAGGVLVAERTDLHPPLIG